MRVLNIFVILLLLLPTIVHSQGSKAPAAILRTAMETRSDKLMKNFFSSWSHASDAVRRRPSNKLQETAEAIVQAVWHSKKFQTAWDWEKDTNSFYHPHYIVMPSKVMIRYGDNLALALTDSLEYMAPRRMHNARVLFDLSPFKDSLNQYMFGSAVGSYQNTRFISRFVSVGCRYIGCFALSSPIIDPIDINSGYDFATVGCGLGLTATLIRTGRIWKVMKVESSGIME